MAEPLVISLSALHYGRARCSLQTLKTIVPTWNEELPVNMPRKHEGGKNERLLRVQRLYRCGTGKKYPATGQSLPRSSPLSAAGSAWQLPALGSPMARQSRSLSCHFSGQPLHSIPSHVEPGNHVPSPFTASFILPLIVSMTEVNGSSSFTSSLRTTSCTVIGI